MLSYRLTIAHGYVARAGSTQRSSLSRIQTGKEGGVLAGAFQSEREEETRDRAERGSVVRGSDQASVAAEGNPLRLTGDVVMRGRLYL